MGYLAAAALGSGCSMGSGCITAVEHTPHDREVVGSNPAGCWAFFSSLSYQKCVLNQVPCGGASELIIQ